ncbi:hypothetical protein [Thalassotalea sp. Y01]|uniref:hypothetical protein n=1 Tax=Thalassotalea sp. Y01 TaxID=2729613 RepID=UPI00145E0B84|nr:hypothetical protein [Thalassotalea sp. Y01]NMP14828.1 hypothetical protein [Thalassotalea sp. Y01]
MGYHKRRVYGYNHTHGRWRAYSYLDESDDNRGLGGLGVFLEMTDESTSQDSLGAEESLMITFNLEGGQIGLE